ncbi:MAG: DUF2225 domain-containing protein [Spirochaetales bacterium]|nr:DUF2225 domain-containing protein [Spirochaetales bacterium]
MAEDKVKKITYFAKNSILCPVCETTFYREEMYTGGGRLMAGKLTEDLRRLFEPSKKYGELFPLIYFITVCPNCYYAAYPEDFLGVTEMGINKIKTETARRKKSIGYLFKTLNFTESRDLEEGVASYYLAVMSYEYFEKRFSPTIKRAICTLRSAWLCNNLHRRHPGENYDYLEKLFYRKARFFYTLSIEREQSGKELLSGAKSFGPDLDKNYGYEGLLYVSSLLEYIYGPKKNIEKRIESLLRLKRLISKTHGIGKASKAKPSAILEKAKDLYDLIGKELQTLKDDKTRKP